MSISVLIVDDHAMFRYGLSSLLSQEADISVAGEASSGVEALAILRTLRPDVILLDISMPGLTGLQALPRILAAAPEARVIMLTAFDNAEFLNTAIMAGAYGYLLKSESPEKLVDSIREVSQGFRLLNKEQLNSFIQSVRAGEVIGSGMDYALTAREVDLLRRLSEGDSYEEISDTMFLSVPTVKRSVNTVISKMMVKNRVQAVAEAVKQGII